MKNIKQTKSKSELREKLSEFVTAGVVASMKSDNTNWEELEERFINWISKVKQQAYTQGKEDERELWKKRVMFVLFQEGSLTRKETEEVVMNLEKGKIDNLLNQLYKKQGK